MLWFVNQHAWSRRPRRSILSVLLILYTGLLLLGGVALWAGSHHQRLGMTAVLIALSGVVQMAVAGRRGRSST